MVAQAADEVLRKLNLIEVLFEEHADLPPPPDDAPETWTEEQIRKHFSKALTMEPQPAPTHATKAPKPDPEEFSRWFPAYPKFKTTSSPRLRILCFPCAGSAEDMYTNVGTGARRVPSPLLDWCKDNNAEVLAVQPPGRGMRLREPFCSSAQDMADALLPLLASRLQDGTPYVIISHSMGCWCAFELLRRVREAGLPLPRLWFLGAMPFASIPIAERPWRLQHKLGDDDFKDECRGWDINEAVFQMWTMFQPLLRADFHIFDSYVFQNQAPFEGLPVHAFWGTSDKRITQGMVEGWRRFTTGPFTCTAVDGNHLWPLHKEPKLRWLEAITQRLKEQRL